MPPKPYVFKNEDDLIKRLTLKSSLKKCSGFFTQERDLEWVINRQVSSNTYKAFRISGDGTKPSEVFRDWLRRFLDRSEKALTAVSTQGEYNQLIHKAIQTLSRYWRSKMGYEIGYGRAAKLINLIMKVVPTCTAFKYTKAQKTRLINYLHIPLDSYTLQGLHMISNSKIPRNASMGFVDSKKVYYCIQKELRLICEKANVPSISYDIIAWDSGH